jgi:hypothetical protein
MIGNRDKVDENKKKDRAHKKIAYPKNSFFAIIFY